MLAVMTMVSMFVISAAEVSAEESQIVDITIDSVKRRYYDANSFYKYCNSYRTQNNLSEWTMDAELMEQAMKKAAELSVFVAESDLDGSNFVDANKSENRGIIVGYDVAINSRLIDLLSQDWLYYNHFNSKTFQSVGIGVVEVRTIKYVCVLLSDKAPVPVDESVLQQSNQMVDQKTSCKVSYLTNVKLNIDNNAHLSCGGDIEVKFIVTNQAYDAATAYISGTCCDIYSTNSSALKANSDGTVTALKPNVSVTITMKLKGASQISASASVLTVALDFNGCTVSTIPDQLYIGKALTPSLTISKSDGTKLTVGKDYTLTYSNNINIGTASVTINGIGEYAGAQKVANFSIVSSTDTFGVSLKANTTNIEVGQSATLIANVTNAEDPVKYKFEVSPQGTANFTTVQSEGTSSSCTYKPSSAGSYTLRVTATDNTGKIATSNLVINASSPISLNISLSSNSITLGNQVTVTAQATGGSTPYQFAYYVTEPGSSTYTSLASFGTLQSLSYTPKKAGDYQIRVDCKGSNDITATKSIGFTVQTNALSNASTVSSTEIKLGETVTLTGKAAGGTSPYTYAFYYKKSGDSSWTTSGTAFGSSTSASIKPTSEGSYTVKVTVKDSTGKTDDKTFAVTVTNTAASTPLTNNTTVSKTSFTVGEAVNVKGAAAGGTGKYTYEFYYKRSTASSWTKFGSAAEGVFQPQSAGTFNIRTYVSDSAGAKAVKDFTLTAVSPLTNKTTVSKSNFKVGETVTVKGAASGGTETYSYEFYYKRNTASTWTKFGSAVSADFAPKSAGTFDIRVYVKDTAGAKAVKNFTLTATA